MLWKEEEHCRNCSGSLFPEKVTPKRLEPLRAAQSHPIWEAKLSRPLSRKVAWLAPGNGSAGRLSALS